MNTRTSMTMTNLLPALLALAAVAASPPAFAQVYKCVDNAGRITYQQAPCPTNAKGGTVNLFLENGSTRESSERDAEWQAAAQQKSVVPGMPKRFVQLALGSPREMRPARGERETGASEVWSYPRDGTVRRIGFSAGAVVWIHDDVADDVIAAAGGGRNVERLGLVMRGENCDQVIAESGQPDRVEDGADPGTGESAARRYIWEPAGTDAQTPRTVVSCVDGRVVGVERGAARL